MTKFEKMRVSVGGDPKGGWLVDIHDGENHSCQSPEGANGRAAAEAAVQAHCKAFEVKDAPSLDDCDLTVPPEPEDAAGAGQSTDATIGEAQTTESAADAPSASVEPEGAKAE